MQGPENSIPACPAGRFSKHQTPRCQNKQKTYISRLKNPAEAKVQQADCHITVTLTFSIPLRTRIRFFCLLFFPFGLSAWAQMKPPAEWERYDSVFRIQSGLRRYDYDVSLIQSSVPANILWPGEQPRITFQVANRLDKPLSVEGKLEVIRYGTRGKPNDVWMPVVVKFADAQAQPVTVKLAANGYADVTVRPVIPDTLGGYALILDLGPHGRRLVTSLVRTFAADPQRLQYPRQSLDDLGPDVLHRLGVQAIRMGVPYLPTQHRDYQAEMNKLGEKLREYARRNITVLLMFGEGPALTPLGTPRSFLDSSGAFLKTKQDYAWLPQLDEDFGKFVQHLCTQYGWPRGPVTAVSLWNEPWEGISISGWQADMLRYREIYSAMAEGVLAARKEGADVLVGGTDSHSNAWDKLFADGKMTFLPVFDFCSIHYEGMESPCLYPEWNGRQSPQGRVKIWDTESWVGNTDDRIGLVVAANRSAGYDRSMGIYGGYLTDAEPEATQRIRTAEGEREVPQPPAAWSPAAAVGAVQHIVGERAFKRLLFPNGLPWVMEFEGRKGRADDGTLVVCGDIGEAFGAENVLFREVRGLGEVAEQETLRQQLAALPADSPARKSLEAQLRTYPALTSGKLVLKAHSSFRLYDFYGNRQPACSGVLVVPLSFQGYFLRTDGTKGSFNRLVEALRKARIEGYEPVEILAADPIRRVEKESVLRLKVTNVLNRPVSGSLTVSLGKLTLQAPARLAFGPHQTRTVAVAVTGGVPAPDNTYPLTVTFDAGSDGRAVHYEVMHVNLIARRPIQIDGQLDDWQGVLPQPVSSGAASVSLTEAAWYPFKQFDTTAGGQATGYLAYDSAYFYFAAKVADATPHTGTYRFETRPDDEFFYPEVAYQHNAKTSLHHRENNREVMENESWSLQKPDGTGRLMHYWEAGENTNSFGVDLNLPLNQPRRVSFYLPNLDVWKVNISIYDQSTGTLLATHQADQLWDGTYLTFNVAGAVRVVVQAADWWYTAKLAALFFDPVHEVVAATSAYASFRQADFDTKGNWKGTYGRDGFAVFGAAFQLPPGVTMASVQQEVKTALTWPEGIRRFSYRKDPVIPDNSGLGEAFDNVLIAFNVIPQGQDGLLSHPPGTMPRYIGYKCTDYEYALNAVAPRYGGGTEIWRLLTPDLNRKHFFPRQPKSAGEGPVRNGKLAVRHQGNTRITECAIPWSEIPVVKKALDEGKTIKFSFRANDNGAGGACLELARERSVSKRNTRAFHPDWKEHWANEVEFGFEK